jgi:hypothetical protein
MSTPPLCRLLIEVYIFYENWSTETLGKTESKKWIAGNRQEGDVDQNYHFSKKIKCRE